MSNPALADAEGSDPSAPNLIRLSDARDSRGGRRRVYFSREELAQLLSLYARWVASGEWRDYALDHAMGRAVFSIFRHTLERPLFSIAKTPQAGGRGAEFSVFRGRQRLSRSDSLAEALAVFDRTPRPVP
jgi:hypothetical protein